MPNPGFPQLEAELALRSDLYRKVIYEYKIQKEITTKQRPNLTSTQNKGLKIIKKRIKQGEYLVLKSDKSGKFVVSSRLAYEEMGAKHIKDDRIVDNLEIANIQKKIAGHTSMMIRMLGHGQDANQEDRFRKSMVNYSENISPGYMTVKDHKVMVDGKLPDTRYMVSGVQGMGLSINNLTADVVEALGDNLAEDSVEIKSSEHLKHLLDKYNKHLEDQILNASCPDEIDALMKNRMLLGIDAKALFPSMTKDVTASTVREAYMRSSLDVWTDAKEMGIYLAINLTRKQIEDEGLKVWVPTRTGTRGAKPGIGGKEARAGHSPNEGGQWQFYSDLEPPADVKKKMLGMVLEVAIKACWELQLHTFGGHVYLQARGGPIGMRITMACSRIVIMEWGREALRRMKLSGMEIWLAKFYVDDGRFLVSLLAKGWQYNKKTKLMEFNEDEEPKDAYLDDESRTKQQLMLMFNDISQDLTFTSEVESDFDSQH